MLKNYLICCGLGYLGALVVSATALIQAAIIRAAERNLPPGYVTATLKIANGLCALLRLGRARGSISSQRWRSLQIYFGGCHGCWSWHCILCDPRTGRTATIKEQCSQHPCAPFVSHFNAGKSCRYRMIRSLP